MLNRLEYLSYDEWTWLRGVIPVGCGIKGLDGGSKKCITFSLVVKRYPKPR